MGRYKLAKNAVELLLPALGLTNWDAGSETRERARGIASALLALLRSRLDEAGQSSLDRLAADPDSPDRKRDLMRRVAALIDADPNRIDLHALVLEGQRLAGQGRQAERQGSQSEEQGQGGPDDRGAGYADINAQEEDSGFGMGHTSHGSGGGRDD